MSATPMVQGSQRSEQLAQDELVNDPTDQVDPYPVSLRPYCGISSSQIRLVFQAACRLRHSDPQTSQISAATGTTLEADVVSAIIEGALRLVAPDRSSFGEALRKERARAKAARALLAEAEFVKWVRAFQCRMLDETEQKQRNQAAMSDGVIDMRTMTPDILFLVPTLVHGVQCNWIEYKNSFGFKSDPFVRRRNRKQYQKYVTALGSGMVVYKLGYESGLLRIDGVVCFREAEIVDWIQSQRAQI